MPCTAASPLSAPQTAFFCDPSQRGTPLPHAWEACIGSGHATLALRRDWLAQLTRCHRELGVQAVRVQGTLADDVGTFSVQQGQNVDSFYDASQICDGILGAGMRPFVELSFMPRALAQGGTAVFHYAANVTPLRYWTVSDIVEENDFSSAPFHGGFGQLTVHGVAKPTDRASQLLHGLGDEQLLVVESDLPVHAVARLTIPGAGRSA